MKMQKIDRAKQYIPYDYEAAYQKSVEDLEENYLLDLAKKGARAIYATRRIDAADQVELEIYPEFLHRSEIPEEGLTKRYNQKAQRNLKDKRARKYCERLINTNFTAGDLWITLTYQDKCLPASEEEATKNMQKYIKRINYRRKKVGLSPARYLYVTEWRQSGKKIRCHHHLVMDGDLPMDAVEQIWALGRRNETRRLDYDENGISGISHYITKDPAGRKRWCASKNLKKPVEHKNHRQFSAKRVKEMVKRHDRAVELISKACPDCWFKHVERRYNEVNGMFYIYAKLQKQCQIGQRVHLRNAEAIGLRSSDVLLLTAFRFEKQVKRAVVARGRRTFTVSWEDLHPAREDECACKKEAKQRNRKPSLCGPNTVRQPTRN